MEERCYRTPVGGIVLVIIGVLLLMGTFDLIDFHWSIFLVIFGALFFVTAIRSADKGGVFPGTILLLTGLLFYLKDQYIIHDSMYYIWPLFLVIVGIAFFVLFIFRSKEWGLMIPGGILIIGGMIFLAHNYDMFPYNPFRMILHYWPVILILIGIKLLIDGRRRD